MNLNDYSRAGTVMQKIMKEKTTQFTFSRNNNLENTPGPIKRRKLVRRIQLNFLKITNTQKKNSFNFDCRDHQVNLF